jgi:CcmD family protein
MARLAVGILLLVLVSPHLGAAQEGPLSGPFRPYLHVFVAFGAAWLIIGAWVFRIGRKVRSLSERIEAGERSA